LKVISANKDVMKQELNINVLIGLAILKLFVMTWQLLEIKNLILFKIIPELPVESFNLMLNVSKGLSKNESETFNRIYVIKNDTITKAYSPLVIFNSLYKELIIKSKKIIGSNRIPFIDEKTVRKNAKIALM